MSFHRCSLLGVCQIPSISRDEWDRSLSYLHLTEGRVQYWLDKVQSQEREVDRVTKLEMPECVADEQALLSAHVHQLRAYSSELDVEFSGWEHLFDIWWHSHCVIVVHSSGRSRHAPGVASCPCKQMLWMVISALPLHFPGQ